MIKDCIRNGIEENFMEQVDGVEKVGKYIENWNKYFEQKDLDGMNREHNKIKRKMKELLPIENTIQKVRTIENIQTLIKNKGNNLDQISEDEIKLAKIV